MNIRLRTIDLASILAVLLFVIFIVATGNPGGFLINGNLNVSETKIINDGNHNVTVNYDITTDYPADTFRVLINNNGNLTEESVFKTSNYYGLIGSIPHHINGSESFKVDRNWTPSRDYLAHIQFNSTGGKVDAGLYERFEVNAFGYLNIYKFNDLNRNGKWDTGEPSLAGWNFIVHAPDKKDYPGITNSHGKAELLSGSLPLGNYVITEVSKPSWIHTGTEIKKGNQLHPTPSSDYENVIVSVDQYQTTNVYFGNRLQDANLTLEKFYDYNGDKNQNGNLEPGISDLTFVVQGGPENSSYKVTTGGDGKVVLNLPTSENGAIYHIRETLPNDRWVCTTPPIETYVTLMPGEPQSIKYGNRLKPAIIGITKFSDDNENGQRESNEKGLSWDFNINGTDGSRDNITTDASGRFNYTVFFPMPSKLSDQTIRSYQIREVPRPGWEMTTPPEKKQITVGPGSRGEVPAFGNFLHQIIRIYKFNDTNKNGIPDPDEVGVPRWRFLIEDSSGGRTINETDSQGMITIKAKPNTRYIVTEYIKRSWEPTTATQQSRTTDSETMEFPPMIFGNFRNITQQIIINKFEDIHNKGIRDADESGLGGWEFEVTGPVNSPKNKTTRVITNENGVVEYSTAQGLYIVKEIKKSGCWINTTNDTVPVYLPAGQTVRVDFGNYQICNPSDPIAFQNPDIEVRKFVDPRQLTTDMIGSCGETYLNYTIQIRPKNKAEATDLVISINSMIPGTKDSPQTINTMVNGIAGFLDGQARESKPSSRVGLIRWAGNDSNEIYLNANYGNLSSEVKNTQFIQTNSTSIFADWTYGISDEFYRVSSQDTKKILVLITDSESPISRPIKDLSANYTIHAVAIGGKETDTTRLLQKLTSEHNGKLYYANDSAGLQNALTDLLRITRPTILKGIQLTETLPSYLKPVSYQVNPPESKNITINDDSMDWNTATIKWWIGNLSSSGKPWNTSFRVRFCWIVPGGIHQVDASPRVSIVNYVREDNSRGAIKVPERAIKIMKSAPQVPASIPTPGFPALISIVGLLAAVYMLKRR